MTLLVAVTLLLLAVNGMRGTARPSPAMAAAVVPTTNRPGVLCPTTTTTCSCQEDEPVIQLPLDDESARSGSLDTRVLLVFACTRTAETMGQMPNFTTVAEGRVAIREVRLDSLGLRSISRAAFGPLRATIPQSLLLNDNLIEHVDADAFVGVAQTLEELDLSHNQLSQLPFLMQAAISGNASDGRIFPNLRKLNLADNRLVSLDGASLGRAAPGLVDLNLSENRLISVEFLVEAALRSLQWLNIGTNRVQRFGRDALLAAPTLFSLMVDDNQLLSIGFFEADDSVTSNPAATAVHPLEILMIQKNRIRTVDGAGLARFHRLSVLDLSQNELDSVHFLQVATSRGGLTSLKELYIASNRLTTLSRCSIAPLAALTNFDYQSNPVECGCDSQWLRNISTLTLTTITHAKCANSPGVLINQFPEPAQECRSQHDLCPSTDINETEEQVRNRQKPPSGLSSGTGATLTAGAAAAATTVVTCSLVARLASHTFGSSCCTR